MMCQIITRRMKIMAKCSKCGAKIEYNQYSIFRGKLYCEKCRPEKPTRKNPKNQYTKSLTEDFSTWDIGMTE